MNAQKIVYILGLLIALVAAFVSIPYAAVGLAIIGLVGGAMVEEAERTWVLIVAIALATVAGSLDSIPVIGEYLTGILTNLAALAAAAAVAIVVRKIYERLTS